MPYPIIDVTHWEEDLDVANYLGAREKLWIRDPSTGHLAMLKYPREGRGEHWAEKLCSEFAKILDFPCAEVELAILGGRLGCLSYHFLNGVDGLSHYDGGKYFPQEYDFDKNNNYNYQLIQGILIKLGLETSLLFIIIFDALVGNGDRHQENWGVTRGEKTSEIKISPLYDNSACLGKEVTLEKAAEYLDSRDKLLQYISKGRSKIGWGEQKKIKHFDLVRKLYSLYPNEIEMLINRLNLLDDETIKRIVNELPSEVITDIQKTFVIQYVIARRDFLTRIGDLMKKPVTELLMVWKDPDTRQRFVVGQLFVQEEVFSFKYLLPEELDEAVKCGFQNYPSFPDLNEIYTSQELFQTIKDRLPKPKRPDYVRILERYGLDPSASEMEILEATHGRTPTDTFEFVMQKEYRRGEQFVMVFELAAARHYDFKKVADSIKVGTKLILMVDEGNEYDPNAVLVFTMDHTKIGFVPKYYSKAVNDMLNDVNDRYEATVVNIDIKNQSPDEWLRIQVSVVGM